MVFRTVVPFNLVFFMNNKTKTKTRTTKHLPSYVRVNRVSAVGEKYLKPLVQVICLFTILDASVE